VGDYGDSHDGRLRRDSANNCAGQILRFICLCDWNHVHGAPVSVLGANFSTAMAASKQKSAKKELIENARFQGDQGMVSSCQKVLDKFEHFNNITAMCLDMGRETLQDTADQHAVLWIVICDDLSRTQGPTTSRRNARSTRNTFYESCRRKV